MADARRCSPTWRFFPRLWQAVSFHTVRQSLGKNHHMAWWFFPRLWRTVFRFHGGFSLGHPLAQKVVFVSGPLLETIVSLAMLTKTNAVIFWKYGQYTVIGIMSFLTCTRVNHHKILPFLIKLHLSKIWWGSHRTRFYSQAKKPWVASLFMLAKEK